MHLTNLINTSLCFRERPFKNNSSFVSRFSERRKTGGNGGTSSSNNSVGASPHSPLISRRDSRKAGNTLDDDIPDTLQK
ncbi:hypothetical protein DPMN_069216 [Dreissena polymorpha]|uniref:Uncharacterized protein n=1 Tax=Dreissena polymorpha TaxID=45954 RepID=A0A9D3Z3P4_DREPO|nr:hypothetical protein DPMN_069216 [Dreissena polymorpha]